MELNKAIQSRTSAKKFKSKKPDWRTILECINAMSYAPMAGNNFTLKVILVDDEEKIKRLSKMAQQDFISQAKYVVVVCSNTSRTINSYGERGKIYCRQQAGAAIQNFLLKIQESGLSTCWIGHFVDEQVKRELNIPDEINIEALFPIGYELEKKRTRKIKIDLNKFLYFNKYKNKKMNKIKKLTA